MIITAEVIGDREIVDHFDQMPQRIHDALVKKVTVLALMLEAKEKQKLSGDVLNVVTGRGRRSIFSSVEDDGQAVYGITASDGTAPYLAVHEYGGKGAYDIVPVKAKALHWVSGGKDFFAKIVHHPPAKMRSFARSSLADMRDQIIAGLREAVTEGIQAP